MFLRFVAFLACITLMAGSWTEWENWMHCDVTCGAGHQHRTRQCEGGSCYGDPTVIRTCETQHCPVGRWTAWEDWSQCYVTCGEGQQQRTRTCQGETCSGEPIGTRSCETQHCPVNGMWSSWGRSTSCRVSCGGGSRIQFRRCSAPRPAFGGSRCVGRRYKIARCNVHPCRADYGWTNWGSWSACSRPCNGGNRTRTRRCELPHGCPGNRKQIQRCNLQLCDSTGEGICEPNTSKSVCRLHRDKSESMCDGGGIGTIWQTFCDIYSRYCCE